MRALLPVAPAYGIVLRHFYFLLYNSHMTTQGTFSEKLKTKARKFISNLAHLRFGFPAKGMVLIGVTGTKGKTITTQLIYHILSHSGLPTGYISTVGAKIGDQELDTGLHVTSPEPWDLPKYLRQMTNKGIKYVVVEATSMGLQQGRIEGVQFDAAVITNIDNDHLDYHGNWESYAESKFMLIEKVKHHGVVAVNADHMSGDWLKARAQALKQEVYASWYSKTEVDDFEQSFDGMKFTYDGQLFETKAFGSHMLENILAAIKVCKTYVELDQIANALADFEMPAGRMEILQAEPFTVIVDFAHTPDSLERSLEAISELKSDESRIITVFGCAGNRDRSRRMMSVSATKYSKLVILTAEDPRTENLADINSEIFSHAEPVGGVLLQRLTDHEHYKQLEFAALWEKIERVINNQDVPYLAFDEMNVNSRIDAIEFALMCARPGDIVYITGKGHEKSLCFIATEYEWSDQEVVRNLLPDIIKQR